MPFVVVRVASPIAAVQKRKGAEESKSDQAKRFKDNGTPATKTQLNEEVQPGRELPLGPEEPETGRIKFYTWRESSPRRRPQMDVSPREFVLSDF